MLLLSYVTKKEKKKINTEIILYYKALHTYADFYRSFYIFSNTSNGIIINIDL